MADKKQIVIVGGGLVGASLALALADEFAVSVIEARPTPSEQHINADLRPLTLAHASAQIFKQLGVWPQLQARCLPIQQVHVTERGRFGAARLTAEQASLPALGYVVRFTELLALLQTQCKQHPGIEWLAPATLTELTINEGALLTLDYHGSPLHWQAELVVGADGVNSSVRKHLAIPSKTWQAGSTALTAVVDLKRPHQQVAFERFTEGGPIAVLPLSNQQAGVVWTMPSSEAESFLNLSDSEYLAQLQRGFGYFLGRFTAVHARNRFPLAFVKAKQPIGPHFALLGNSAHSIHPIAGQGFNLSLRDAVVFARQFINAKHQGKSLKCYATLTAYQRARERDQAVIMSLTDGLHRLHDKNLWPLIPLRSAARMAVEYFPPARKLLLDHTLGIAGLRQSVGRKHHVDG